MKDRMELLELVLDYVSECILVVMPLYDDNGNQIDYIISDVNQKSECIFSVTRNNIVENSLSNLLCNSLGMSERDYSDFKQRILINKEDNLFQFVTKEKELIEIKSNIVDDSKMVLFLNKKILKKDEKCFMQNEERLKTILNTLYVGVYEIDITSIDAYLKKSSQLSSERLRTFLKRHDKFLLSLVQSMKVLDTNPYGLQIFEAENLDQINDKFFETVTPEFLDFVLELIISLKEKQKKLDRNIKIVNFHGESLHLLARSRRPRENALDDRLIICLTNVTPMKKIEEELKAQKDELAASYEQLEAYYEELNATEEELRQSHEELNEMYESLRQNEERLKLALLSAEETLWDYDINSSLIHFHESWSENWGYNIEEYGSSIHSWINIIHPDDKDSFMNMAKKCCNGESKQFEKEFRIKRPDDSWCWIYTKGRVVKRDDCGIPTRIIGTNRNISQRKDTEEKLEYLNSYDSLTGLPNYLMIKNKIDHEIKHSVNYETGFALLFLDLDRFKSINETLGHSLANELLKRIGKRLVSSVRKNDLVGRVTSDEFVILLTSINKAEDAAKTGKKVQNALSDPFIIEDKEVFITASMGIVVFPDDGIDFDTLVKNGETAVASAKKSGKNNYKFYSSKMDNKSVELFELETALHKAIINEEFEVFYQPQINAYNGEIKGAEALIRWNHPEKGLVSPGDFIPLAEETGLIINIGNWVLENALKQLRAWNDKYGTFKVSINISSLQFSQENFEENVINILNRTGVKPENVYFELTESIMLNNLNHILKTIKRLKDFGIKFSIDDFGTGYSSLGYLRKFPIDQIKIDRSFIRDLSNDYMNAPIVKTIINLADNLEVELVAEGIENDIQKEFLLKHKCSSMQGYLFGRPSSAGDFENFFTSNLIVF